MARHCLPLLLLLLGGPRLAATFKVPSRPVRQRPTFRVSTVNAAEPWEVELSGVAPLGNVDEMFVRGNGDEMRDECAGIVSDVLRELLVKPALARHSVADAEDASAIANEQSIKSAFRARHDAESDDRSPAPFSYELEDAEKILDGAFYIAREGREMEDEDLRRPTNAMSRNYKEFVESLRNAGCTLDGGAAALEPTIYNICLSMDDCAEDAGGAPESVTRYLNAMANDVARVLLYGYDEDATVIEEALVKERDAFVARFASSDEGGDSDELWFYDALTSLCVLGMQGAIQIEEEARSRSFSWANSLQRLLGLLVQELGIRFNGKKALEDPILSRFVAWESQLRQNITGEFGWNKFPRDLYGEWRLEGSADAFVDGRDGVRLEFKAEGRGTVAGREGGAGGLMWGLLPGPTHLDTCEFSMDTADGEALLLFTAYVDRGQRIETRFSKRPVRMRGRVVRRRKDGAGVDRPMGKFVMEKGSAEGALGGR